MRAPGGEAASPPDRRVTWPTLGYGTLPIGRILVVQTGGLREVLCATPLFTALRTQFPLAYLTALVQERTAPVLWGNPDLNEVLVYNRRTTHRRLLGRMELVVDIKDRQFDWALAIHAPRTVGFAFWQSGLLWRTSVWHSGPECKPHWSYFYHQHLHQDRRAGAAHEIEHNLDLLRDLGMEPRHAGYRLMLAPEERERARQLLHERGREEGCPLALIHPGPGKGRQPWPPERYAEVADGLAERGYQVGITGGASRGAAVARDARAPVLNLAGAVDLRGLAALLAEASLFISGPTGAVHLASAMGVPAITLHGSAHFRRESTRFGPYESRAAPVFSSVPCTCSVGAPCADAACMKGITPVMILDAAGGLVGGPEPTSSKAGVEAE